MGGSKEFGSRQLFCFDAHSQNRKRYKIDTTICEEKTEINLEWFTMKANGNINSLLNFLSRRRSVVH